MDDLLKRSILNVPIYTWILQLAYVGLALAILFVYSWMQKRSSLEMTIFIIVMIVVNITWRVAIR